MNNKQQNFGTNNKRISMNLNYKIKSYFEDT